MTSPKKAAANRVNGSKSRGPRTGAGKARASHNARRHGLAAFSSNDDPAMAEQVEQMVDAICAGDDDPFLRQQAVVVAENQLWLSCVRAEKVALIERLRDPTAFTLASEVRITRAKARIRLVDIADRQLATIHALIKETEAAEREPVPRKLQTASPPSWVEEIREGVERDEYEAMREGVYDLVRLLRYEQRAWSRRKRAVRAFMAVKLANHDRRTRHSSIFHR